MNLQALFERFDILDAKLRSHGLRYGPDVWLQVRRLLNSLQQQQRLPQQTQQLAPLLGPLFCRYPEDQARFPAIFLEWLDGENRLSQTNQTTSAPKAALIQARLKLNRHKVLWLLAIILLALGLLGVNYWIANQRPPVQSQAATAKKQQPQDNLFLNNNDEPPAQTQIPLQNTIAPRPQPEPFENPWPVFSQAVAWTVPGLPVLAALLWMARQYRRRQVMRAEVAESGDTINQLVFERPLQPIFGGNDAERNLRDLRAASYLPTRRLDTDKTVERTARSGDFFQPVYWHQRQTNQHVMLVRVQHPRDQQAAMAQELANRFRGLGLSVAIYRFRDDPRHLQDLDTDKPLSLQQLLSRYRQDRLLIISETEILYDPLTGSLRPWLESFKQWTPRIWLHSRDADGYDIDELQKQGFLALPLRRDHFADLVDRLTGSKTRAADNPEPWPLPESLRLEPDVWLREKPPAAANLPQLLWDLQQYLGNHGLTLLRALAVYPKPHWHLSLALDFLLYGHLADADSAQRRETRLSRLSRLPWLTQGYLPRWLREFLLTTIDNQERQHICSAWQKLFMQLTDSERPDQLQLDFHAPGKRRLRIRLNELRALYRSELDDAIFSNILLGGRLSYLDFQLPLALSKIFPHSRYWLSIKPATLALIFAVAGFTATDWLWQRYLQPQWEQTLVSWLQRDNPDWQIQLTANADTQPLAQTLISRLQVKNFQTRINPQLAKSQQVTKNVIEYPPEALEQARQIAKSLRWLTYDADVSLRPTTVAGQQITVELNQTYQTSAEFKDALRLPWYEEKRLPFEPETVVIPAGSFLMGSPESEAGRSADEGPQHQVTFAKPFAIGKTEVTFAQYDAFADATGRKKPDDNGWGRGNRPVINVSFDEAQAYAKWLSDQTGEQYRLPTEAEWEYAARAGTTTPFHSGNCISTAQANYDGNYDYNGCGAKTGVYLEKTQEVGKYPANAWGLNDTAGNVWEWTADCWHENYQNAPQDGSQTWQEANQGDCRRRVVRGCSWDESPDGLRSANRHAYTIVYISNNILGFRIARAL